MREKLEAIKTGYKEIDRYAKILLKGGFTVVGGSGSVGKTEFMLHIIHNVLCESDGSIIMFSPKMSQEEIYERMEKIDKKKNETYDHSRFLLKEWPNDPEKELPDRVKQISEKEKIEFVVVDGLQDIKINSLGTILKGLASEMSVPIIALARSSEAAAKREDHHPLQRDLPKEVVEEADVLVLLYRESLWNSEGDNKYTLEVTVSKNLFGPIGALELESL